MKQSGRDGTDESGDAVPVLGELSSQTFAQVSDRSVTQLLKRRQRRTVRRVSVGVSVSISTRSATNRITKMVLQTEKN